MSDLKAISLSSEVSETPDDTAQGSDAAVRMRTSEIDQLIASKADELTGFGVPAGSAKLGTLSHALGGVAAQKIYDSLRPPQPSRERMERLRARRSR